MIAAVIAQLRALYPLIDTAAASDVLLEAWYPHVSAVAGDMWHGEWLVLARAHLLAHAVIQIDPTGALAELRGGPVAGIRTGRRAITYAQTQTTGSVSLDDAALHATAAGRAYMALRDTSRMTAPFVI